MARKIKDEDLIKIPAKQPDWLSLQKKHKNLLLALLLTHLDEPFECFRKNELKGSPIFDSSCDDLVESLRGQNKLTAQIGNENNPEQSEIEEQVSRTILILLISIYAEALKLVGETFVELDSIRFTETIQLAVQYSLSRDENQTICEKIIKLSGITDGALVNSNQDFLSELAASKFNQAKELIVPDITWALNYAIAEDVKDEQDFTKANFIKCLNQGQRVANILEDSRETFRKEAFAASLDNIQKYN